MNAKNRAFNALLLVAFVPASLHTIPPTCLQMG